MYGKDRKLGMFVSKYPEYLIGESLPDGRNSSEIEENRLEQFKPCNNPFGLRA